MRETKFYCDRCRKETKNLFDMEFKVCDNIRAFPVKRKELCESCASAISSLMDYWIAEWDEEGEKE